MPETKARDSYRLVLHVNPGLARDFRILTWFSRRKVAGRSEVAPHGLAAGKLFLLICSWLVAHLHLHEVNDRPGMPDFSGCMCELPFTIASS